MRKITNTTEELKQPENAMAFLASQIGRERAGEAVLDMEAQGQWELIHSDVLPVDIGHDRVEDYEALGFKFGDAIENDPIFRYATLPDQWTREPGGNSYWSYLIDEAGNERVGIFYKAAFYDRHAHMFIIKDWDKDATVNG